MELVPNKLRRLADRHRRIEGQFKNPFLQKLNQSLKTSSNFLKNVPSAASKTAKSGQIWPNSLSNSLSKK
jgi:hypothetical protein